MPLLKLCQARQNVPCWCIRRPLSPPAGFLQQCGQRPSFALPFTAPVLRRGSYRLRWRRRSRRLPRSPERLRTVWTPGAGTRGRAVRLRWTSKVWGRSPDQPCPQLRGSVLDAFSSHLRRSRAWSPCLGLFGRCCSWGHRAARGRLCGGARCSRRAFGFLCLRGVSIVACAQRCSYYI